MNKKTPPKTQKKSKGTAQALNQPNLPQPPPEPPHWPIKDNTPWIPKPTPMDLITAVRHIIGPGTFPKNPHERDLKLRDALRLWQDALHLISDYRRVGIRVADMDPTERKEFIELWADCSGPRMEGDEIIKFITEGERPARGLRNVEDWLKSGHIPWDDLRTMENLKSPKDKGTIIYLRGLYKDWKVKRNAAQNAEKGRASAKQKAAAEKKKRG